MPHVFDVHNESTELLEAGSFKILIHSIVKDST